MPSFTTYLVINSGVEGRQAGKGYDVHDDQVEPGDVDVDVCRIVAHVRRHDVRDVGLQLGVVDRLPRDLPEAGYVIEEGKQPNTEDIITSPAKCAEGPRLQGETDGHVALDRHAHCQVHAPRLGNHPCFNGQVKTLPIVCAIWILKSNYSYLWGRRQEWWRERCRKSRTGTNSACMYAQLVDRTSEC